MASANPFDLLGDDDTGELSLLIAAQKAVVPVPNKVSAQYQAKPLPAKQPKLPSKPPPPAQAVRESKFEGGRSGGRGYGRGRGGGGYRRDFAKADNSFSNSAELVGQGALEDGESRRRGGYGGPRSFYGGLINGEVGDGERPRRMYGPHSGTGRGSDLKREGSGFGNWGSQSDEFAKVTEEVGNEGKRNFGDEKRARDKGAEDANKEGLTTELEEKEPEKKEMTLEEYEKVLEEKRKALQALKTEGRKVDAKEFESMQQLSNKKSNDEIFIKLSSGKDKRKEAHEKEERARKSLSINEFLKPAEGKRNYNPSGRGQGQGQGRGRGSGGFGGGNVVSNMAAPSIEDPGQFPTLGGK